MIENELTDKQRAILIAELNGMPHAEIAVALGMNRNAVYKLSHDARKRAKFHLEAAGVAVADVLVTTPPRERNRQRAWNRSVRGMEGLSVHRTRSRTPTPIPRHRR